MIISHIFAASKSIDFFITTDVVNKRDYIVKIGENYIWITKI